MYGRTRLIPPIVIDATNNQFVVTEFGGSATTVSITAGTYWGHAESGLHATYPGLYKAVTDALTAALSNIYAFRVATPTESSLQSNGGIALRATTITTLKSFTINFTHANFTMNPGWFGMLDNAVVAASDKASALSGGAQLVTMPYCRAAEWLTWNIFSWRGARDQRSTHLHDIQSSDADPRFAYEYDWSHDDDGMAVRTLEVPVVPAAHIYGSRALDSDYADTADLAHGDTNNGLKEIVWERARILRGEGTGSDVIIVYNDVSDLEVTTHDYDIGRIHEREHRARFEAMLGLFQPNGEFYNVNSKWALKTKGYDH